LRLEQRLGLLHADDQADLRAAESLIRWSRQPVTRTTQQLARLFSETDRSMGSASLRELVRLRMNMRTVVVALRMRRRGIGPPETQWGVGPYVRPIALRWGESDFGLGAVFPWIAGARAHLERGDAMELESLLMDQSWRALSRVAERHPFGFEDVYGFVFKWDILKRWLSCDPEGATNRFDELIGEVTRDHQQLFA